MSISEFIHKTEERLISENQTQTALELNLFVYNYEQGRSLIRFCEEEFLCLSPIGRISDAGEDEVKIASEKYHIYKLSQGSAVIVTDPSLKEKILAEYEKHPANSIILTNTSPILLDID